jgi:segregation and condensation protein A
MGVAVTFVAILELMREGLIEIAQVEAYAPIHVRAADPARAGRVIEGSVFDAEAADARLLEQTVDEDGDDEEPLE